MGASRDKLRAHRRQDWFALCYADQAVRRVTETIPTFFANLRAHVHIQRSHAICARRRALSRPVVRPPHSTEPYAQKRHNLGIRECNLWTMRLQADADWPRFVRQSCHRKWPALGSLIASRRRQNRLDGYEGCAFLSLLARARGPARARDRIPEPGCCALGAHSGQVRSVPLQEDRQG